ncbi:hypothetical protein BJ166DRAFT_93549 [Pestalotiopsis sp. NC0098]|nr:hypothetical protein BJ166DRAFT_93549 [Pestalotiopsis sp. NC0098]
MSKLVSWIDYTNNALSRNPDLDISNQPVSFPLPGVRKIHLLKHLRHLQDNLKGHNLSPARRKFKNDFGANVHQAYKAVSGEKAYGTGADLRQPLEHIKSALLALSLGAIHDDKQPVVEDELPRRLLKERADCNPKEIWLQIKLDFTKICLELLIQILKSARPEFIDLWTEGEATCKHTFIGVLSCPPSVLVQGTSSCYLLDFSV